MKPIRSSRRACWCPAGSSIAITTIAIFDKTYDVRVSILIPQSGRLSIGNGINISSAGCYQHTSVTCFRILYRMSTAHLAVQTRSLMSKTIKPIGLDVGGCGRIRYFACGGGWEGGGSGLWWWWSDWERPTEYSATYYVVSAVTCTFIWWYIDVILTL